MWRNLQQHSSHNIISIALKISSLLFFLLSSLTSQDRRFVKAHSFIYGGCSPDKYQPTSTFEANLNSLLSSIANSASQSEYNSFVTGNGSTTPDDAAIYGLY
uniref:Uncharacterized protein n=1 Tax=Nelumbo nucifera TaxID=4432 RepID=A0A822XK91_NELNU|nr:TPA_asm: hypothetical protein HUJ06_019441 [Nelumbo nucifera]